jgi:hypothetical protein
MVQCTCQTLGLRASQPRSSGPRYKQLPATRAALPQILNFYNIRGQSKWVNVGYEACFLPVFFVAALLALTYVRHQKR